MGRSRWTVQYQQKVLASDPVAYFQQGEKSGTIAYDLVSGRVAGARNAAYTGATLGQPGIGDGHTAVLYDGLNDLCDAFSASLAAAFNGAEGSFMVWTKILNAGVWTDAVLREILRLQVDGTNLISLRSNGAGQLQWLYFASGVTENIVDGPVTDTDWMCQLYTWSHITDETVMYRNGARITQSAALGAWVGVPVKIMLFAEAAGVSVWSGWGGPVAFWDYALSLAQIEDFWKVQ